MNLKNFEKVFTINNPTAYLVGGAFLIFVGGVFQKSIDSWTVSGVGSAILGIGSAIVGAGVFSAVTNSADFTKLFENHIYNVVFSPENSYDEKDLFNKWNTLTRAILKKVLPSAYADASKKIEEKFFNNELEYHFEDFAETYKITIRDDIAEIVLSQKAFIHISPNADKPKLIQKFRKNTGDEEIKLKSLFLNNQNIEGLDYIVDENEPDILKLEINLNDYRKERIKMVKTVSFKQNLKEDPYVKSDISRFVKGFIVDIDAPDSHEIIFKPFGLDIGKKPIKSTNTGVENTRKWVIAESQELLIPGQGYIFLIIKKS